MPTLTASPTLGDLLKHEYDKDYCRESAVLAAGDALPIGTVLGRVAASGQYKPATASGSDGAQIACAVLLVDVAASAQPRPALILARGPAIVSSAALSFDASVDTAEERAEKLAQLSAHGIVARTTV